MSEVGSVRLDVPANLRDVAGLRLAAGGVVRAGVLYRGDAPFAGDEAPDVVPVWPPAVVIDLRTDQEAATGYVWPDGVTVHRVPLMRSRSDAGAAAVVGGGAPSEAERSTWRRSQWQPPSLAMLYGHMLDAASPQLASLFALAAGSADGPVFVHCTAGKDRTGVAVAVMLLVGGVEPADIVADYTATTANVAALLARMGALGQHLPDGVGADHPLLSSPADAIGVVIDRLSGRPGGPWGWALEHGASAADLTWWRERLTGR